MAWWQSLDSCGQAWPSKVPPVLSDENGVGWDPVVRCHTARSTVWNQTSIPVHCIKAAARFFGENFEAIGCQHWRWRHELSGRLHMFSLRPSCYVHHFDLPTTCWKVKAVGSGHLCWLQHANKKWYSKSSFRLVRPCFMIYMDPQRNIYRLNMYISVK